MMQLQNFINSFKANSHTLLAIISILLVSLLILAIHLSNHAEEIFHTISREYRQIDNVDEILIDLLSLKTRGIELQLSSNTDEIESYYIFTNTVSKSIIENEQAWYQQQTSEHNSELADIKFKILNLSQALKSIYAIGDDNFNAKRELLAESIDYLRELSNTFTLFRNHLSLHYSSHQNDNIINFSRIKWVMVLFCFIAFILMYIIFMLLHKQKEISEQTAALLEIKNHELESRVNQRTQELQDLAFYLTSSNENERKKLACELHDELGALLTAARIDTTYVMRKLEHDDQHPLYEKLTRLLDNLDKGITLKREITNGLVPPLLKELGLIEAIKNMVEVQNDVNDANYKFNHSDTLPIMDSERELALYRICQESLTNIRKYAQAENVVITLTSDSKSIFLAVEDDGIGFNINIMSRGTHGLTGMRSRAAMFKGEFDINSTPGKGTCIRASIPYI